MTADQFKRWLKHDLDTRRAEMDAAVASLAAGDATAYQNLLDALARPQRRSIAEIRAAAMSTASPA